MCASSEHIPIVRAARAEKTPGPCPAPLQSTITRGAPLPAAPKSWRQIASTPFAFGSLDPHDDQRSFRQLFRYYFRSHTIRNTRLDMNGIEFPGETLLPDCANWRPGPLAGGSCLFCTLPLHRLSASRVVGCTRSRRGESQRGIRHFEYCVSLSHNDGDVRSHPRLQAKILIIDAHHNIIGHHI